MNEKEAKQISLKLMETADAAYLTTVDSDGFPQTRAMLNLRNKQQYPDLAKLFERHQEDFFGYFTTNTSSLKMEQLKKNLKVSVYYCLPKDWHGLLLSGEMEIVKDPEILAAVWQPGWELYYPGGVHDPDYTVLALQPARAKYYYQLASGQFCFPEGGFNG